MSDLDTCLAFVWQQEGGFSDNAADPGGATYRGLTLATYRAWMGNPNLTADDLKAVSDDVLAAIAGALFWNPIAGNSLPSAVAMMTMDFAYNAGVRQSAVTLQHAVGADEDGSIGPITLAAVASDNARFLIGRLAQLRIAFYRSLTAEFPTFGRGWIARVDACEAAATALLPGAAPDALKAALAIKPHPLAFSKAYRRAA